ncbi:MAG: aldehyde dehydrogenase family protein [Nitrosomonadales bacterium]|nr:aldehyde dehydrogenase family protein [Nitrosomonadales bacterium]
MRAALLLVDLQQDYLNRPGLQPPAARFIHDAAKLLELCRRSGISVLHAVTRVRADGSDRMPHWQRDQRRACVAGTSGVLPPQELAPLPHEPVFAKTFFNPFDNPELGAALAAGEVDTLIIAGLYTHACVRAAVLDAYRLGYEVWLARDAVASTEPEHARLTLDYLAGRAAHCLDTEEIAARLASSSASSAVQTWPHHDPCDWGEVLAQVPLMRAREVAQAVCGVRAPQAVWGRMESAQRAAGLQRWLGSLEASKERLIALLVREVGKPLLNARAEFDYAVALLQHTLAGANAGPESGADFQVCHCPVGVVGLITPWNNPLAIPVGKLAPALLYGNAAVWKPALQASQLSRLLLETLVDAGCAEVVALVTGDSDSGRLLTAQQGIDAISFTGSIAAGRSVAAVCAAQGKALQAELGGNNAVIVMDCADVESLARQLAPALFSFSGQRCTAPRRLIVQASAMPRFEAALVRATAALRLGMPEDPHTQVGPLISREQQTRMLALTEAAKEAGARVLCGGNIPDGYARGCWFAPTLVADVAADSELAQEESFGPIAVLMQARDMDHALELNNGVKHGLVTMIFSDDESIQRRVAAEAQSGIVAINQCPLQISPAAPFGGWKASGIGEPEHGRWDRAFYTRPQAVYAA